MGPNKLVTVFGRRLTKRASFSQFGHTMLAPSYPPFFLPLLGGGLQRLGSQVEQPIA